MKRNPKRFFTFIKSKRCDNIGVSPLQVQGKLHINDKKKANILNNQFSRVFSEKDDQVQSIPCEPVLTMPGIRVTVNDVKKLQLKIDSNKTTCPDNITGRFLKEVADEIAPALTLLFNASLKQGIVPNDWKRAMVNPIYKAGKKDRSNPENYRPTSLACITCKILKHIVHSNFMQHLDANGVLNETQHGFRKEVVVKHN